MRNSPFRIVLAFAIAVLALYEGYAKPDMQMLWYSVSAFAFVTGIYRFMRYNATKSQNGSDTPPQ